ncbi:heavy metal-binding domain-containing protein [Sphaerospermopsis torques-reginae]|uniref:YbjQ family protein n=1 Tax=Sphaerospermopsis torques-reginae ITEP-024 TaxID=984208 RepID=A0ABX8WWK4_9CYAN|nr:heavy metal-binding domain-containing protein [Sphaerospermopsis torques-reginae]QYX30812.1 YbjQ family protein [Sphaerospermopsis torques-reginae ITEP-024]
MDIIIATGDIKEKYDILEAIFALDSHTEGFLSSANPGRAFDGVKQQLRQICKSLGGDAVINCQFEYRVALADGFLGKKQAFEIFAYGTAVKIKKSPQEKASEVVNYLMADSKKMDDFWNNLVASGAIQPSEDLTRYEQLRKYLEEDFHLKEIKKRNLAEWYREIDSYFK